MHFTSPIFLMLSTAASIQASWTVPENQPDGSYLVTVDEAGVSHHEKVDGLPPVPASERRTINSAKFSLKPDILRRETYSTTCLGYYLDHGSADTAGSGLKSQCGSGGVVRNGSSFYTKGGSAVAWFCNTKGVSSSCYSWEATDALVTIGPSHCGNYAALYSHFNDKGGTYGQADTGFHFCYSELRIMLPF